MNELVLEQSEELRKKLQLKDKESEETLIVNFDKKITGLFNSNR